MTNEEYKEQIKELRDRGYEEDHIKSIMANRMAKESERISTRVRVYNV